MYEIAIILCLLERFLRQDAGLARQGLAHALGEGVGYPCQRCLAFEFRIGACQVAIVLCLSESR